MDERTTRTLFFRQEGTEYQVATDAKIWERFVDPTNRKRPSLDEVVGAVGQNLSRPFLIRLAAEKGHKLPSGIDFWNTCFQNGAKWTHVMDDNCVLVEARTASAGPWSGQTIVLDDPELAANLKLGKRVLSKTFNDVATDPGSLAGTILVASPGIVGERARQLASLVYENLASLVVWRAPGEQSEVPIVEVRTKSASQLPLVVETCWLRTFLKHLHNGAPLSIAMLSAYRVTRDANQDQKLLSGHRWLCEPQDQAQWQVELTGPVVPQDWKSLLDRFTQSAMFEQLSRNLCDGRSATRIQVVITPGSKGAGLKRFSERFRPDRRIAWAESRAHQIDELAQQLAEPGGYEHQFTETIARFISRMDSSYRAQGSMVRPVLHVAHDPTWLALPTGNGRPSISMEHLVKYIKDLDSTATAIRSNVRSRMLVHIPVLFSTGDNEEELRRATTGLSRGGLTRVSVLPMVLDHVAHHELLFWLESHDLDTTIVDAQVLGQPYDALLEVISERLFLE